MTLQALLRGPLQECVPFPKAPTLPGHSWGVSPLLLAVPDDLSRRLLDSDAGPSDPFPASQLLLSKAKSAAGPRSSAPLSCHPKASPTWLLSPCVPWHAQGLAAGVRTSREDE